MSIAEGLDVFDCNIFLLYIIVEQKTQPNVYGFRFPFVKFTFSQVSTFIVIVTAFALHILFNL